MLGSEDAKILSKTVLHINSREHKHTSTQGNKKLPCDSNSNKIK